MGKRKKARVSEENMEDEEQYQDDLNPSSSNDKSLYEVLNLNLNSYFRIDIA